MKTLIKISFLVLSLLFCTHVLAQNPMKPITLGVKGGMNVSEIYDLEDKLKVGFNIGFTADYQVTENWFVMSGLELTTKGAKSKAFSLVDNDGVFVSDDISMNGMYLQIPIHAGYKLDIAPGTKLVFRAGPYLAYGIGGKIKGDVSWSESVVSSTATKVKYDEDFFGDGSKKFEFGIGGAVGVEFGKIGIDMGADLGLTKIWDGSSCKNRVAHIGVSYKIW